MTKTEARRQASRQLGQVGYFRTSSTTAWMSCLICHGRVDTAFLPWDKPTTALRIALTAHLIEEH